MLESDSKNKRKCSVCRQVGHDKRKCPQLKKQIEKKSTQKSSAVLVKIGKPHKKSNHVVNLKADEKKDIWNDVKVYQDKGLIKLQKEIVDLAHMVRKANLSSDLKEKIEVEIDKKQVLKKEKKQYSDSFKKAKKIKIDTIRKISYQKNKIKENFSFTLNFKRLAYSVIVILLLVCLPFPVVGYYNNLKSTGTQVVEESTQAFMALQSSTVAVLQSNLTQAESDLNLALKSFSRADSILDREHKAVQYVASMLPIVGRQIKSRQHLLVAGHNLALGNTYLIKGLESIKQEMPVTDKINLLNAHLKSAIPQYEQALHELSSVHNEAVPVEYQESFKEFKILFTAFVDDMQDLVDLSSGLSSILGDKEFKRYLLAFQNNNEIRSTGGFMGSFAILDLQKGKMLNLNIPGGGSYDLQGQLNQRLIPPLPLQLANDRWEFQDSNWFPHFPASAQKMAWFYEQARGATVDGVIAINASVLERILAVLGTIQNKEHDLKIASNNALEELQYEVEIGYDKDKNQPKEVLSGLVENIFSNLNQIDNFQILQLLVQLNQAVNQKEVQVYFNDSYLQDKMSSFGWTGEILKTASKQDYLLVSNSNINGQKTDAKIKQTIEHQAEIQEDGSVINTVVIHRQHNGYFGENFYGVNNVNYLRIYVPKGSELLEAGGFTYPPEDAFHVPENWYEEDVDLLENEKVVEFEKNSGTRITNEFGKTAFGNWTMVMPGETTSIYFKYKLPFKIINKEKNVDNKIAEILNEVAKEGSRYSILVQKQSGMDSEFKSQVIYPAGWQPVWQENSDLNLALNGAEYETVLKTDKVFGLAMEKK